MAIDSIDSFMEELLHFFLEQASHLQEC